MTVALKTVILVRRLLDKLNAKDTDMEKCCCHLTYTTTTEFRNSSSAVNYLAHVALPLPHFSLEWLLERRLQWTTWARPAGAYPEFFVLMQTSETLGVWELPPLKLKSFDPFVNSLWSFFWLIVWNSFFLFLVFSQNCFQICFLRGATPLHLPLPIRPWTTV